jgi:outer membrane protein TolC
LASFAAAPPRAFAADAKAPVVRALSLTEAITIAHRVHPSLAAARARIEAARAAADVPRAGWRPTVGATAQLFLGTMNNSAGSWLGSPVVDLPRIGATPIRDEPQLSPTAATLVATGVRQTLWDFGLFAARGVAADALVDLARAREIQERLDLELAVTEAFLAVRVSRAIAVAAARAAELAGAHRDRVQALVERQLRPPVELARADADVARFEVGRLRAEQAIILARSVYAAAIGVEEVEIEASGELPASPPLPTLDRAIAIALGKEPEIKSAAAALEAQRAETDAIRNAPLLFATGSISGRAGGAEPTAGITPAGDGFLPLVPNWNVGVVLTLPILDPTVSARRDAARAIEDVRRDELANVRLRQRVSTQRAWLDAQLAAATLAPLERAAAAAKTAREQASALYGSGLSTSLEVADAEARELDAQIELEIARFESARARARLSRLMGERS